jgi:phosphatidylserine/phosphatidylglycerophosphate/cardiolipin synthase-like enzyme
MATNEYQLVSRPEYFRNLVRLIDATKKGSRVAVASMTFVPTEPLIMRIMDALCDAARRGVHTSLIIDAHSFLAQENKLVPGPLWSHRELPSSLAEPFHTWVAALKRLESSGGRYAITNIPEKPFRNPYAGRSHIKGAVIDDYIYIGGCNLQDPEHTDIMIGRTHKESADWVYKWFEQMTATASTQLTFKGQDQHKTFADGTEIIIDAGVIKQSAIYDRALRLIDTAQERIYMTCQYFPGGKTAKHLLDAHKRGVDVRIIYSHPAVHGDKRLAHTLYNTRERMRMPADFFAEQQAPAAAKLHAKVLITDATSLIGSHNYVTQGVNFGTAEIALQNNDPAFAGAVIRKIGSQL